MTKFSIETQCWAHWPKVLVVAANRDDGTTEFRRYVLERACEVAGVYTYGERDELRAYALSCGHEFDWDHADPPAYCPCCGAKVVSR